MCKNDLRRGTGRLTPTPPYANPTTISLLSCFHPPNKAGIDGPTRSVEKASESAEKLKNEELQKDTSQDWLDVYSTNVVGHYFMSTTFLPLLSAATKENYGFSGSIVNITSISGITRTCECRYLASTIVV